MAAAAWSWVEKMLHEAQRTSAPSSFRVSMSTPVWMVMCREPMMRTPLRGLVLPYFWRVAIRPGISCSAISSSLRPKSARLISATWKFPHAGALYWDCLTPLGASWVMVDMDVFLCFSVSLENEKARRASCGRAWRVLGHHLFGLARGELGGGGL